MTTPLAKDFDVYDLTADRVVDGPWPPRAATETPAAVIAEPDALAPAKKKGGRPKGSKSKKAKSAKAAKTAKAPAEQPVTETKIDEPKRRIAAGGEGVLSRVRRMKADQWVWILIPVAAIALAVALAFLTGVLKP